METIDHVLIEKKNSWEFDENTEWTNEEEFMPIGKSSSGETFGMRKDTRIAEPIRATYIMPIHEPHEYIHVLERQGQYLM